MWTNHLKSCQVIIYWSSCLYGKVFFHQGWKNDFSLSLKIMTSRNKMAAMSKRVDINKKFLLHMDKWTKRLKLDNIQDDWSTFSILLLLSLFLQSGHFMPPRVTSRAKLYWLFCEVSLCFWCFKFYYCFCDAIFLEKLVQKW